MGRSGARGRRARGATLTRSRRRTPRRLRGRAASRIGSVSCRGPTRRRGGCLARRGDRPATERSAARSQGRKDLGVLLGSQDVRLHGVDGRALRPEQRHVRLAFSNETSHGMRRHVGVRRHLHRDCPPGRRAAVQRARTSTWSGTHCRLAAASTRSKSADDFHSPMSPNSNRTTLDECSPVLSSMACELSIPIISATPSCCGGQRGQLPWAAPEIGGTLDRRGLDQREQIVKRLGSFLGKSAVLLGIPVRHDLYCTCI